MSTEYLHYIASVSQINRRERRGDRERNLPNESSKTQNNFGQSLNHDEYEYRKDRAKVPKNTKSILVAESNSEILSMLILFLNSLGYDYDVVRNGDKVLQYFSDNESSKKKKYDVVL